MFPITSGAITQAQRVLIYGPEGIGKTTLAAQFPGALFIDTEGGSGHLNVRRLPTPTSWTMLMQEVSWIRDFPEECATLVIDTADWAEKLCIEQVCKSKGWSGIEDPGYGKGYTYVKEEFGHLLNLLSEVRDRGVNIVLTAHATISKFELPDEMGAYDRWELKLLRRQTAPMVKEWADAVLFATYKTIVVDADANGKRKKAQGGKVRVLRTTHAATWDAKNRWGLSDEVPMDWAQIAPHIPQKPAVVVQAKNAHAATSAPAQTKPAPAAHAPTAQKAPAATKTRKAATASAATSATPEHVTSASATKAVPKPKPAAQTEPQWLAPIRDLMRSDGIEEALLLQALAKKGYITRDTPFSALREDFAGWLTSVWPQITSYIAQGMPDTK
ncbi:ATP-binding protein [Collinsella sp. AGMB00827]|uniref:ATP-binding protein n=1 Tax=Collinsella ureilytica TaxID=2869515 RepID=A0ABS7MHC8_9ACTN|nr:ATP-binding protein [Collinsella urealyticum]MBY4796759.1 ATP-binding protein [Collinsella urealyticum]